MASSVLVDAFRPAQKAFSAAMQQQQRLYTSAVVKQHAYAAKRQSLRSMKEAVQLPKNLQLPLPNIYGEGMEDVKAAAAAALKQAGHTILDAMVSALDGQVMGATAAANDLAATAPSKVQAVMSTLPASWQTHPVVISMQHAALESLAYALQQARDTQGGNCSQAPAAGRGEGGSGSSRRHRSSTPHCRAANAKDCQGCGRGGGG